LLYADAVELLLYTWNGRRFAFGRRHFSPRASPGLAALSLAGQPYVVANLLRGLRDLGVVRELR
jgi:hypothetical protein